MVFGARGFAFATPLMLVACSSAVESTSVFQAKRIIHAEPEAKQPMLWMSALSGHPDCTERALELLQDYKVAILSWDHLNSDTFEPYLVVHVPEETELEELEIFKELEWIRAKGGHVIKHTLSFIDDLQIPHIGDCRAGVFLRYDLPNIARDMSLFGDRHFDDTILFTDMDVMWWSHVNVTQLEDVVLSHRGQAVVYSAESVKDVSIPMNAGVMFIQVSNFLTIRDEFLNFCRGCGFLAGSGNVDEGLLNHFFEEHEALRSFLTVDWNYKVYWGQDADDDQITLIHFHGPKPGRFLECIANRGDEYCEGIPEEYNYLRGLAIDADGGRLAEQALLRFERYLHWFES